MIRFAALLLAASTQAAPAMADPLRDATQEQLPKLVELYRELHASPELSLREEKTAARLAALAKQAGFQVTERVGGYGVVAVMKNGPGPVVLIRTDTDGLPVTEATGLPYASKVRAIAADGAETGVMHACGHDTHMAAWIGTMRNLVAMKDRWSGTLVMIAQPAEEVGAGAKAMLDDGLYTRFPKPNYALAFHDSAAMRAGQIGVRAGYIMANVDSVDIVVKGVGGHGAAPHMTRDPVVLGARIVGALQTLVSRELDPQSAAVVTVGSFRGGSTHNIISDEATLLLTVRSYSPEDRRMLLDGIARVARGEAIATGLPDDKLPVVRIRDNFTPAVENTEALATRMNALFAGRFGNDRIEANPPSMVGEDFSRYHLADREIESLLFWVGGVPDALWEKAQADKSPLPSLHSPFWAPDAESVIGTAAEAMTAAALDLMPRG
jgi:amidohydrolase